MNCAQTQEQLPAYLDGELDAEAAVALAEHLNTCARCAGEMQRRQNTARLIQTIMAPAPASARELRLLRQTITGADASNPVKNGAWHNMRFGIPALAMATLLGMTTATLLSIGLFTNPERSEKYVYHVNNSETASATLQNIKFHLQASPKARFVVVTHNEGVDFLLREARDRAGQSFEPKIRELTGQGVQFRVCMNTLRVRNISQSRVLAQAQFVPSGIAEVGRLQVEEGFAYLKP